MYVLLDKTDQRKIDLILKVFQSELHTCKLDALLETIDVRQPTLIRTIEDINDDIESFDFTDLVKLNYSDKDHLISIVFSKSFNLQKLINAYVRKSIKFRLLEELLGSSFKTLQEAADHFHVSYVHIRRIISEINEFFGESDISINTRRSVKLTGNEIGIRVLYSFLLLTTYGGEKWIFPSISFWDANKLIDKCPNEVYQSDTLDKSFLIRYLVAIHLIRTKRNHLIKDADVSISLYSPHSRSSKQEFAEFCAELKKHLPHFSNQNLEYTAKVICSSIISLGDYTSVKSTPDFFFLDSGINHSKITSLTLYILDRIDHHLYYPLTYEERNKIMYALMCLHYRVFFMEKICIRLSDVLPMHQSLTVNELKDHKLRQITQLIDLELKSVEFDFIRSYETYLALQYSSIYDRHISFPEHTSPIKIALVSTLSNLSLVKEIQSRYSAYFNIKIADVLSSEVDIIITDLPIAQESVSSILSSQTIIFCHNDLVESDFTKITKVLSEIAQKKFKTKIINNEYIQ